MPAVHCDRLWTQRSVELLRKFVRAGGVATLHAAGSSMSPQLRQGERLVIEHVDPAALRVGEVVVFYRGEKLIAHRIVKLQGEQVTTRGDATEEDAPILRDEVIGRVVGAARGAAHVALRRGVRRLRHVAGHLKRSGLGLLRRVRSRLRPG